jgi:spermidine synthase
MRIQRPYALELDYTRAMMVPLLLHGERDWPRRVLLIGLGAASITKFLYRHRPRAMLTVVEIEPKVVAVARHHFRLPDDPRRLTIAIGNGDAWLAASDASFDLVMIDGFDARGSPGSLDSTGFYRRCAEHLSDRGLVVTNLLARTRGVDASIARLMQAFDDRVLVLPPCEAGNTVALAASGGVVEVRVRDLAARAERLRAASGLNLKGIVAALARSHGGPGGTVAL